MYIDRKRGKPVKRNPVTNEKLCYINELNRIKPFIKLSYFCDMIGLNQATLSRCISDSAYYHMVSEGKLSELLLVIISHCESVGEFS